MRVNLIEQSAPTVKIIIKGITGLANLEFETRIVTGGRNFLVSRSRDKKLQQALALDLLSAFRVFINVVSIHDYIDHVKIEPFHAEELSIAAIEATPEEVANIRRQFAPFEPATRPAKRKANAKRKR